MLAEEAVKMMLLFDFYGGLLPEKQQEIISLYYGENLSLSEIGEELDISRQGVHDALKKATASLEEYDGKLRLLDKFQTNEFAINTVIREVDGLSEDITATDKEYSIDKKRLTDSINIIRSAIKQIEI